MILRDDDLPQNIPLERMKLFHDIFIEYDKIHTMAIIASQLEKREDFVNWVNTIDHKDLTLHGWNHTSYPEMKDDDIRNHLSLSIDAFNKYFNIIPKMWYLPWNGWTKELGFTGIPRVKKIAEEFGISVNEKAVNIGNLIKGDEKCDVVYFHAWQLGDEDYLKILLENYEKYI